MSAPGEGTKRKKRRTLDDIIEDEVKALSVNDRFLPDEYRRLRKAGRDPRTIGYDECHVWR